MPLYEYQCRECNHRFEILQRLGEGSEGQSCPQCGHGTVEKVFSTFAATTGGVGDGAPLGMAGGGCCRGTPT